MSNLKNIYSPEKAAKFLNITILELQQLAFQGDLILRKNKGTEFFLGGELDCIKSNVHQRIHCCRCCHFHSANNRIEKGNHHHADNRIEKGNRHHADNRIEKGNHHHHAL